MVTRRQKYVSKCGASLFVTLIYHHQLINHFIGYVPYFRYKLKLKFECTIFHDDNTN